MSDLRWRLLGEQPAFDRNVPQAWKELVLSLTQIRGELILHDPALAPEDKWVGMHVRAGDDRARYAIAYVDTPRRLMRIYVTADDGEFGCDTPLYEGHWRPRQDSDVVLPWPESRPSWSGRQAFLAALDRVEMIAPRIKYRGISICRLCGSDNGHEAFRHERWEWPRGYRHYIADHDVRPTPEFEAFIADHTTASRQLG